LYENIKKQHLPFKFYKPCSEYDISQDAKKLLTELLKFNASERIDWQALAAHKLLRDFNAEERSCEPIESLVTEENFAEGSDHSSSSYHEIPYEEDSDLQLSVQL
jgi:serine/threonine protein kinase